MDRLVRALLLTVTLAACSCAGVPKLKVAEDTGFINVIAELDPVEVTKGTPGIDKYRVRMIKCGFWNAFAVHDETEILLCSELVASGPAVMRMILLHEAGHVAFHAGTPFTGMEELAADEYAAVRAIWDGRRSDVKAVSDFWYGRSEGQYYMMDWGGSHPSAARRAVHAWCLWLGSGPAPQDWNLVDWYECRAKWKATSASWHKILGR